MKDDHHYDLIFSSSLGRMTENEVGGKSNTLFKQVAICFAWSEWPWSFSLKRWGGQRSLFVGPVHVWIVW